MVACLFATVVASGCVGWKQSGYDTLLLISVRRTRGGVTGVDGASGAEGQNAREIYSGYIGLYIS